MTEASTTTVTCPVIESYTPWWTDTNQLVPTLGVNDSGGYLVDSGTWAPPTITATAAATTTTTAPAASNTFDVFQWDYANGNTAVLYAAGSADDDWCNSYPNQVVDQEGNPISIPPSQGDLFTVCGVELIVGGNPDSTDETFTATAVGSSGVSGTCLEAPGPAISACIWDGLDYNVYLANTCDLTICP